MKGDTISLTYNYVKVHLLEWDVVKPLEDNEKMRWEPQFEIAFDHDSQKTFSLLYIDAVCYYSDDNRDYAAMIKTRNVFSLSKFKNDIYPPEVVAMMMDHALTHTRSLCVCKCNEENISLPVIPYFSFHKLVGKASVAVYKPSILALSHGQIENNKTIAVKDGRDKLKAQFIKTSIHYFEPLPANHPECIADSFSEDEPKATISQSYDYEILPDNGWNLHLDFAIAIKPIARIRVRTSFFLSASDKELYTAEVLDPLCREAFENSMKAFKQQCTTRRIEFDGNITLDDEMIHAYSESIIDLYYNWRKKSDENNRPLMRPGMSFTVGENTLLVINGTFLVLDEILFLNPAFDRVHNREAVSHVALHEPLYFTIREKCFDLENGPIQLTWIETVLFYLCVDIALQILLSDHGDALQQVLKKNNFTPFRQQEYIKFANEQYQSLLKSLKESGGRISNLEERKDWAAIIR